MPFAVKGGVLVRYTEEYNVRRVSIPVGVHTIGSGAFKNCVSLSGIVIPDSVRIIGAAAFQDCVCLKELRIPQGVTSLPDRVCSGCATLRTVHLPESLREIGEEAFSQCFQLQRIQIPSQVRCIGRRAFMLCGQLQRVTLPEALEEICAETFSNCTKLRQIDVPVHVNAIGRRAFYWCLDLAEVSIAGNLRTIGNQAFENCVRLSQINLPDGLTEIGDGAFLRCRVLTELLLPMTLRMIGKEAFYECTGLRRVDIPAQVEEIRNAAFAGCIGLTAATIPESITKIGREAFMGCRRLTDISFPPKAKIGTNALKEIPWLNEQKEDLVIVSGSVYQYRGSEETQEIPAGVTHISGSAFSGSGISRLVIPEGIVSIGDGAFERCNLLEMILFPDSLESMGRQNLEKLPNLRTIQIRDICMDIKRLRESAPPYLMDETESDISEWDRILASLRTGDYAEELPLFYMPVRLLTAAGYYVQTKDARAREFLLANAREMMELLVIHKNDNALGRLLEERDFVSRDAIDSLISLAVEQGTTECRMALLHYKADVLGYEDPAAEFQL